MLYIKFNFDKLNVDYSNLKYFCIVGQNVVCNLSNRIWDHIFEPIPHSPVRVLVKLCVFTLVYVSSLATWVCHAKIDPG